jgi:hypothetical protein
MKGRDRLDHAVLLRVGQLRVERQAEDLARRLLRVGAITEVAPEVREARLQMERPRVVHGSADPLRGEVREQTVPVAAAHDEVMHDLDALAIRGLHAQDAVEPGTDEPLAVPLGAGPPRPTPIGERRQLRPEDGRLQRVEAAVDPDHVVDPLDPAVGPEPSDASGPLLRGAQHHAAVTPSAEVLRRVKRQASEVAEGPCRLSAPRGVDGLGDVLDDRPSALARLRDDGLDARHAAEQVDREHGARARRGDALDALGVEVEPVRLEVDEARDGTGPRDRPGGREIRERRGDDLVPGADPCGDEREVERITAVRDADGRRDADSRGHGLLERANLVAEDEPLVPCHPLDRGLDARTDGGMLRVQVDERDRLHDGTFGQPHGVVKTSASFQSASTLLHPWAMSDPTEFKSFEEFWPFYVQEHANATNRRLHFVGTGLALGTVAYALLKRKPKLLLLAPLAGYGFAWVGHFLVEKNRPATFKHPLWSLRGDFKMFGHMLAGTMDEEVRRVMESGDAEPEADAAKATATATPETSPAPTKTTNPNSGRLN